MDLFMYPEAATHRDGLGIGVEYAYNRETPKADDVVVWLSSYDRSEMKHLREKDVVLKRNKLLSLRSFENILKGRHRSEFKKKDLLFLKDYDFDVIHCDDVVFYKALRELFPEKQLRVRLHNCFSRIEVRNQFLKKEVGLKYGYALRSMKTLETEIFNDRNVYKIFISDEDRDFYRATYGITSDSETWQYSPDRDKMKKNQAPFHLTHQLVWYGGVEAHKESSVRWFINEVLPVLKHEVPDVEFHLWGRNTQQFDSPANGVFGHGFYKGEGLPLTNCLYVNPDIIGGGIKLKLMTLMEKGVPFISTPFGFEGYEKDLNDGVYCHVIEMEKWPEAILSLWEKYKSA